MTNAALFFSQEHSLVYESVYKFSQEVLKPTARQTDREHRYPKELVPKLAEMGFWGVCVSEQFAGSAMDNVSYSIIVEQLARACASVSVVISAHNSLALWPLEKFGTEGQKKKYLPELALGKQVGSFALSEPGTGSDASALSCMAKREKNGWRVNGVKNWITNAPVSDICILLAMEEPAKGHEGITAFIVELKNTPGVSIGKKEDKLGICGSPTASISFEDVFLDDSQLLGERGKGFIVAMKTLDGGRIGIASQAVGIAQAALDDALLYSRERETFGKPIAKHQSIQNYLADMSVQIEAARLLTLQAALRKDRGLSYGREAAQAKLYASEVSVAAALKAIQIHGGYGYVRDYNVERYLRDAKITEIYEGTSEIQRLVIANALLKEGSS